MPPWNDEGLTEEVSEVGATDAGTGAASIAAWAKPIDSKRSARLPNAAQSN